MWNENDPILKERLFGLTNTEGNHGEDVKEYYFYVDNLPTHSYQRWLYKYPHRAFPYDDLVATNRSRSRVEVEYELIDTGVFDDDRYFDVEVEYAKDGPDDILCRITVHNRGAERRTAPRAPHAVVPQHVVVDWRRRNERLDAPALGGRCRSSASCGPTTTSSVATSSTPRPARHCCSARTRPTHARLWGGDNPTPYVKDGINDHVVDGLADATNPAGTGTKVAAHTRRGRARRWVNGAARPA